MPLPPVEFRPGLYAIFGDDGNVTLTGDCMVTGEEYSVVVDCDAFNRWRGGAHCQDAFPELSAADREFLISRTSPKGWGLVFGPEEDD